MSHAFRTWIGHYNPDRTAAYKFSPSAAPEIIVVTVDIAS
jgi:hypothetical protein